MASSPCHLLSYSVCCLLSDRGDLGQQVVGELRVLSSVVCNAEAFSSSSYPGGADLLSVSELGHDVPSNQQKVAGRRKWSQGSPLTSVSLHRPSLWKFECLADVCRSGHAVFFGTDGVRPGQVSWVQQPTMLLHLWCICQCCIASSRAFVSS